MKTNSDPTPFSIKPEISNRNGSLTAHRKIQSVHVVPPPPLKITQRLLFSSVNVFYDAKKDWGRGANVWVTPEKEQTHECRVPSDLE